MSFPTLSAPGPLRRSVRLRLGFEIIWTYCTIRWQLRRLELDDVVSRARHGVTAATRSRPIDDDVAFRLVWIVERILDRLPGDNRCLTRTLVLTRLLSRRGIGARVVLGVRVEPEFGAHAWPELAGRPLMAPIEATGRRLVEL